MNTLLELQVWLKIALGLVIAGVAFIAAIWIYVIVYVGKFIWRVTRRH